MSNNALQIIADACEEIGLVAPDTIFTSTDQNIVRLRRMLNREGRDLAKSFDWAILIRTHTFATTNGTTEYDLPSDYDHLIHKTEWDRTGLQPLTGPLSPQDWQAIQSGSAAAAAGPYTRYRLLRSATVASKKIVIDPAPGATASTLAFEYVSNCWCTAVNGTTLKTAMTLDTDVNLFDQDLVTLGTIVRFKRSVGLDYASEADEYMQALNREKARDRPAHTLDMAGRTSFRLIDEMNVDPTASRT